ncbi:hypothetical protein ACFP1Z_16040 [Streptomyces gamaensis]|uniref:Uncharacterized protein n=1 Tax=Streptomyces gamaensis TaxID=1763542 RepID=A0ABW0Z3R9_9ACTN
MRNTVIATAVVLSTALAPTAGPATAATGAPGTRSDPSCGADNAAARTAGDPAPPASAPVGDAAETISYSLPAQLPIGMWSPSGLTLRTPAAKGTVRLDVTSSGFGTDSLAVQRYDTTTRKWVDLSTSPGRGSRPEHGAFTFPLTADASGARPYTVALRMQDLDRPGKVTVTASVDDGKGHTYRAPARTSTATRPEAAVTGWKPHAALRRGGPAGEFALTVRNTTDRAYPALRAAYFAYGEGKGHSLAPKDLILQQYVPGKGWQRLPLAAGGCDPGLSATLRPAAPGPLAPGAAAAYRLRLAVAASAPRDVRSAEAGVSVSNGEQSFFSQQLPFTLQNAK